jgi:predicted DNA-binding transcriptional regulator AlpA
MPRTPPVAQATSRFINDIQAASYLGCAVSTLRNHRQNGSGPRYTKIGASVRYTRDWLDAYALQTVIDPKSAA